MSRPGRQFATGLVVGILITGLLAMALVALGILS